jgi:hypothetical protein
MAGNVLHLGLSENYSLVWAIEASATETYCCVRCGVELSLDTFENEFRHPPSTYCSAWLSSRRCAVLLLQKLVELGTNPISLTQMCSRCGQKYERKIEKDSACYLLSIEEINDAVLIESDFRLLIAMRPIPNSLPRLAKELEARWVEVDARNVLIGSTILALSGNMQQHTCTPLTSSKLETEKINNPYSRIRKSVHQGGAFAE